MVSSYLSSLPRIQAWIRGLSPRFRERVWSRPQLIPYSKKFSGAVRKLKLGETPKLVRGCGFLALKRF